MAQGPDVDNVRYPSGPRVGAPGMPLPWTMVRQFLPEAGRADRPFIPEPMKGQFSLQGQVIDSVELRPQCGLEKPHIDLFVFVAASVNIHPFTFLRHLFPFRFSIAGIGSVLWTFV